MLTKSYFQLHLLVSNGRELPNCEIESVKSRRFVFLGHLLCSTFKSCFGYGFIIWRPGITGVVLCSDESYRHFHRCVLPSATFVFALSIISYSMLFWYLNASQPAVTGLIPLQNFIVFLSSSALKQLVTPPWKLWGRARNLNLVVFSFHFPFCQPTVPAKQQPWAVGFFFSFFIIDSHVGVFSLSMLMHKYLICSQLLKIRRWGDMKGWVLIGAHWGLVGATVSRLLRYVCIFVCACVREVNTERIVHLKTLVFSALRWWLSALHTQLLLWSTERVGRWVGHCCTSTQSHCHNRCIGTVIFF